jgi:hypothetical protein
MRYGTVIRARWGHHLVVGMVITDELNVPTSEGTSTSPGEEVILVLQREESADWDHAYGQFFPLLGTATTSSLTHIEVVE